MPEKRTDHLSDAARRQGGDIQERPIVNRTDTTNGGGQSWAKLLRGLLPSIYEVVTKGKIISRDGRISREVEVLVLKRASSEKLMDKNLYSADCVAAAFDCKTTLLIEHIMGAVKACTEIKGLYPDRIGTPYRELHAPIIYGVLAHSYSWKGESTKPESDIEKILSASDGAYVLHPRECLDLLCVANLGTWKAVKVLTPLALASQGKTQTCSVLQSGFTLQTAYMMARSAHENRSSHFTPIGSFIFNLSRKLAWEDARLPDMSQYYRGVRMERLGSGKPRPWNFSFSKGVMRQLRNHRLNFSDWSEWSVASGL